MRPHPPRQEEGRYVEVLVMRRRQLTAPRPSLFQAGPLLGRLVLLGRAGQRIRQLLLLYDRGLGGHRSLPPGISGVPAITGSPGAPGITAVLMSARFSA